MYVLLMPETLLWYSY